MYISSSQKREVVYSFSQIGYGIDTHCQQLCINL